MRFFSFVSVAVIMLAGCGKERGESKKEPETRITPVPLPLILDLDHYKSDNTCALARDFVDQFLQKYAPEYKRQNDDDHCYLPKKQAVQLSSEWDNVKPVCANVDDCFYYTFTIKDSTHALDMLATFGEKESHRQGFVFLPADPTGPFLPPPNRPQPLDFYQSNAARFSNPNLVVLSASFYEAVSR